MTAMIPYSFEGNEVRLLDRDGEPWFVLADVCRSLEIANPRDAAARLDEDEKMTVGNADGHSVIGAERGRGGAQSLTIINESGLYSLILTSRKAAAKRFKKWITAEVLPSIRKTGMYVFGGDDPDLPAMADGKVFGVRIAKVNAAARLISCANAIFGPEAARALWAQEPGLPRLAGHGVSALAGTASDDPVGCFGHLLRQATGAGGTVGQMLGLALHDKPAARKLKDFGLLLDPSEAAGYLAIANQHPFLARAFAETQWIGDWRIALAQLPGARPSKGAMAFGGGTSKAVLVSRGEVIGLMNPVHH